MNPITESFWYDSLDQPFCDDKKRLLREYNNLTLQFSSAVTELAHAGMKPTVEWNAIRRKVDKASEAADRARIMFERHVAQHGC